MIGMPGARALAAALLEASDRDDVANLQRFFKTGKGQYGHGDRFIGVRVPVIRRIAKDFVELSPADLNDLLDSDIHEHRFAALIVMVGQYQRADASADAETGGERERLAEFYLAAMRRGRINNWDLVDCSAEFILGEHFFDRPRGLLGRLARSGIVWERRIAVLTTFGFIKRGDASTTLELAAALLADQHDLIQKAVGWMLREVGKRVDRQLLLDFLDEHAAAMPRTMLSYATEHLDPALRASYRSR